MIRIGGNTGSGGEVMISSASTAIPAEGIISAHDLGLYSVLFLQKNCNITILILFDIHGPPLLRCIFGTTPILFNTYIIHKWFYIHCEQQRQTDQIFPEPHREAVRAQGQQEADPRAHSHRLLHLRLRNRHPPLSLLPLHLEPLQQNKPKATAAATSTEGITP